MRAPETVQLREFVGLVRRKIWLILVITATLGGISFYFAFSTVPRYRAVGAIRLSNTRQELAGRIANEDQQGPVGVYNDPLKTQIQVLTSRSVATAVVDRVPSLQLKTIGFSPTLLDGVQVSPRAISESLVVRFDSLGVAVRGRRGSRNARYGSPIEFPEVRFVVSGRPGVGTDTLAGIILVTSKDQAVSALVGGLKATPRSESDVIDVEYTSDDPVIAQRAANAVIESYKVISTENSQQQSRRRRVFVEEQLRQNDSTLAEAERALASFRSREQTFGTKEKFSVQQGQLLGVAGQRQTMAADQTLYSSLLSKLEASRGAGVDDELRTLLSTPGIGANPVIAQLYLQLVKYQTSHDSLVTGPWSSAPTHPDVQRLDTLIASTEARLVGAVRSQVASLSARIAVLDSLQGLSSAVLSRLPQTEAEEMRLTNQAETIRKMGDQLREEYQRAKISEAVQIGQVEIVDLASAPGRRIGGGKLPKLLVGLLVGLVLGIGTAYIVETLNTSINRRDEVEEYLHVPSLAVLPRVKHSSSNGRAAKHTTNGNGAYGVTPQTNGKVNGKFNPRRYQLVSSAESGSPDLEAYITLRTNLLLSRDAKKLHRLVVTSPAPRDGKTTVAANLAVAFALHGTRTLLVDCDFRRPRVHSAFGVKSSPGFTDALLATAQLADCIRDSEVENLFLLPVGKRTQSPSQLLTSDAAEESIAWLSTQFDMVVLDTPPVLAVADAAILGSQADGVLLVVRAGSTARDEAQTAAAQLAAVGAKLIGVALNDPNDIVPQYSPYYYNYYTYYSASGANKA